MLNFILKNLYYFFFVSIFIGSSISLSGVYPLRLMAPILLICFILFIFGNKTTQKNTFLYTFFWLFSITYFIFTFFSSLFGYASLLIIPEINDVLNFVMLFLILSLLLLFYKYDFRRFYKTSINAIVFLYFLFLFFAVVEIFFDFHFPVSRFYATPLNIPTAFFTNPNDFASIFTLLLLVIFTHFRLKFNFLTFLFLLVHIAIVFYTGSRLSIFVILLYVLVFRTKTSLKYLLFAAIGLSFFWKEIPTQYKQLFSIENIMFSSSNKSENIRKNLYIEGAKSLNKHFGLGLGINASSKYYKSLVGTNGLNGLVNPHNYLVEILINSGLVNLFLFIILNLLLFYSLFKKGQYEKSSHIIFFNVLLFSSSSSLFLWPIYFFMYFYFVWADDKIDLIET